MRARLGVIAMVLTALALGSTTDAHAAKKPTLARVKVDLSKKARGDRIPREFLGFSLEYGQLAYWFGHPSLNEPLVALLRRLGTKGAGSPTLRFGGASTEHAWGGPEGQPNPPGVHHRLTPYLLDRLAAHLDAARSRAVMGVSIAYPDTRLHTTMAGLIDTHLGRRVMGLELGNEPGFYPERYFYTDRDGRQVFLRPSGWGPQEYLGEIGKIASDIRAAGIDQPLAGPAIDYQLPWVRALPASLRQLGPTLGMVALHAYPLTACDVGDGPDKPFQMLLDGPMVGNNKRVGEMMRRAATARPKLPVRITETNSASCGGIEGGSDTFVSSLWGLDHFFSLAALGVSGVNMHASSQKYQPLQVVRTADQPAQVRVKPVFYAMQLFADAVVNRPRMIPSTWFARRKRGVALNTWGLHDRVRGEVRVVAVYKGGRRAGPVQIRLRRGARVARVRRLRAPSIDATEGIRWAGRTYPTLTSDGSMSGQEVVGRVRRRSGGRYRFLIEPGTAAMVTIKLR